MGSLIDRTNSFREVAIQLVAYTMLAIIALYDSRSYRVMRKVNQ
jgi:hypothetical protein